MNVMPHANNIHLLLNPLHIPIPNTGTSSKPCIVCYTCQQPGHLSTQCPKKNSTSSIQSSSLNRAPSSWQSQPPVATAQTTSYEKRSTSRVVKQPDRYQPPDFRKNVRSVHHDQPEGSDQDDSSSQQETSIQPYDVFDPTPASRRIEICEQAPISRSVQHSLPRSNFSPPLETICIINGYVARVCLDSGASLSIIDSVLVKKLKLPIKPIEGQLRLAHPNAKVQRVGTTPLIDVTFAFLGLDEPEPAVDIQHSFEVMPLDVDEPILIGRDLLPRLFPKHKADLYYQLSTASSHPHNNSNNIQHVTSAPSFTSTLDDIKLQSDNEDTAHLKLSSFEGVGYIPPDEAPDRTSLAVSESTKELFEQQRAILLNDPDIISALAHNATLGDQSFCNIPESTILLELKDGITPRQLYLKQYPIAETLKPYVNDIIKVWLANGRICVAPPCCPYNNPLTTAPKKDSSGRITGVRVCLDTRRLNNAIKSIDKFPLPRIWEALARFSGDGIFGEFDLKEAYLQFRLDERSRPFTAFTWEGRQYMFIGCPFGLSILPSHFQRIMSFIFADLPFTFPYLDNLPFASQGWEQHRDHALMIINRLNQYSLHIKPASVKFGYSEMRCLGHVISITGIALNPDKLQQALDWSLPKSGKQLQRFLGFINFLRHPIRHMADLTAPLEAVKHCKEIVWKEEMIHNFETIKHALSSAPTLKFADFNKRFVIATDASNTGVGGVLFQPDNDDNIITADNIVGIISKKLNNAQRNYSTYKKELFAIITALRAFHNYIWGRTDLIIITDHKPLEHMLTSDKLSPALQQWLDTLLDYQFSVIYRPGILNVLPDALSRMYSEQYSTTWGVPANKQPNPTSSAVQSTQLAAICLVHRVASVSQAEGGNDEQQQQIQQPQPQQPNNNPQPLSSFLSALAGISNNNSNNNNEHPPSLLIELEKRGMSCPTTQVERQQLIQDVHNQGHFGITAVLQKLWSKKKWWPSMQKDIKQEISNCDACARFTVVKKGFDPAHFISSTTPWDHIQIDTSTHLPESPDGYKALLVIIDVFSGFIILRALKQSTAEAVAGVLWELITTFGIPRIIQSDNGPEFANDIIRALVKLTGIEHRYISPYNPRADGKVERAIGTISSIIKKMVHGSSHHWPMFVPFAQLCFNLKTSSLTNSTPFSLMFGRNCNEFKDYSSDPLAPKAIQPVELDKWKEYQKKLISLVYPSVSDKILLMKDKMIKQLNNTRRLLTSNSIPAGATVMVIDPLRRDKFEPKYIGPYTVIRRSQNGSYVLKDATGDILDRRVQADQMKLISINRRRIDINNQIYEVDSILNHRGTVGNMEYLIKWKNYPIDQATWEPATNILDDTVVRKYWDALKLKQSQASSNNNNNNINNNNNTSSIPIP